MAATTRNSPSEGNYQTGGRYNDQGRQKKRKKAV
jgi:hypothetical protein